MITDKNTLLPKRLIFCDFAITVIPGENNINDVMSDFMDSNAETYARKQLKDFQIL